MKRPPGEDLGIVLPETTDCAMPRSPLAPDAIAWLEAQGLNLCAVFDLAALPAGLLEGLDRPDDAGGAWRQLILLGNRGGAFWQALQRRGLHGAHPVDQFVTEQVAAWMQGCLSGCRWRQVFPGPHPVGLQRLGMLAGWHHTSPFWVGVDAEWGSWFAYRAVVVADTNLVPTPRRNRASPCEACDNRPCISACPAGALAGEAGDAGRLPACLSFRKQPRSPCQDRCLAREACPVGAMHRYPQAQLAYHYLHSLQVIRGRW